MVLVLSQDISNTIDLSLSLSPQLYLPHLKMCLLERLSDKEREGQRIFHLLVKSPNVHNSDDCTKLKPGARAPTLAYYTGGSDPSI